MSVSAVAIYLLFTAIIADRFDFASSKKSVPSSKNPSVPPLHATSTAQPIEPTPSNSYESSLSSSKPSVSYLPLKSSAPSSPLDTYLVMKAGDETSYLKTQYPNY